MELTMDRPRRMVKTQTGLKARISSWFDNQKMKKQLDGMQADYAILTDQYQLIKNHVFELEKKISEINESSAAKGENRELETPYSVAILLAKKGCERNEIIKECGLTDSEADLILALHTNSTLPTSSTSAIN